MLGRLLDVGVNAHPHRRIHELPTTDVSGVWGRYTGKSKMSAVICMIESLREPPPVARSSVIRTPFFFSVRRAPLFEREDDALQDRPVQVGASVDITEAEHSALRVWLQVRPGVQ